ncbi:MAG: patatin-like phospholipase family protein [Alphaproteobacteria bacterium]|nr:patatin-like phospholipase family protein [Alphaproteobacteria bacterium]
MVTKAKAGNGSGRREGANNGKKRLNLALQGGGSHGAYAWGVLDRLFEEESIEIDAIVGTSAGAMNATVTAYGWAKGNHKGAREALGYFWKKISEAAKKGPLQPSLLDKMIGRGNMDFSAGYIFMDALSRMMSPYQLNPMNVNPLRDTLLDCVDFDFMHQETKVKLFICASNVMTGRHKIFTEKEVSVDAVLASACLPFLFQAVEIDGQHYWDGGYMGNPPLYPLFYHTQTPDVLIVQINPINIPELPTTAQAILDRINTLSFNSSLMREMRAIHFVTKLIDGGFDDHGRLKRVNLHTIDAEEYLGRLSVSSKINADWDFLMSLFELGRSKADDFLNQHYDKIGVTSSTDIATKFL